MAEAEGKFPHSGEGKEGGNKDCTFSYYTVADFFFLYFLNDFLSVEFGFEKISLLKSVHFI